MDLAAPLNTNGTNGHDAIATPETQVATSNFDPAILRTYLSLLLPPVIGALPADIEALFDDEFDEKVTKFAGEGGDVIYVVKAKDDAEGVLNLIYSNFHE
jgi:hypothetical protein